ncbi:MAG: hypothetical protein DRQ48_01845 [Gammaproteobacteria bacterium]|nr:MAG: hypothetical protein DRQ48_01845 [Gammaproteobacteria bacterium]
MVDLKAASDFLSLLDGDSFTFQTFTDNKEAKKKIKKFDPLGTTVTGTFDEHKDLLESLSKKGAGVFVQINAGKGRGKKYIDGIRAVFIDLDNPDTSDASLQSVRKYMPRASIFVESSKGKYHLYWKVKDCPLDLFSSFQRSLAIKFFSDISMSNLDRVMRIPGFPHQKKEPQNVRVIMSSEHVYSVQELKDLASNAPNLTPTGVDTPKVSITTDVFGMDLPDSHVSVSEFKDGSRTNQAVAEIGYLISQGFSASEVRAKIESINENSKLPLTDTELNTEVFGCIDKWVDEREAEKKSLEDLGTIPTPPKAGVVPQPPIDKPSMEPPSPPDSTPEEGHTLGKWIDRFRFVEVGSRVIDTTKNGIHAESSLADFKNKYANVFINSQAKLHNRWFQYPGRKDVRDTIYYPTAEKEIIYQGETMWNIYTPSEVNPVSKCDPAKIRIFLDHIKFMFPGKPQQEIILKWLAMTVRHPEIKIPWAPLLISKQGVGKGFIYKTLELLVGAHNCAMILPDRFDNQFNGFMERQVICIDEMKNNGRQNYADKMKSYISETTAEINKKGVGEVTREVFGNFIIFTNHADAAFIEDGDRRFWVYKIAANKHRPEYYSDLWKWLREEPQAVNHLLRFLMDIDLTNYDHATVPIATEAKLEMVEHAKSALELEVIDAIANRDGLFAADLIGYTTFKDYVEMREGNITKAVEGRLRHLWGKLFVPLPNAKSGITPNDDVTKIRQRVRCFRNFEHWSVQPLESLKYELTRSIQMATGAQTILPANLKDVSGDKDAKPSSS